MERGSHFLPGGWGVAGVVRRKGKGLSSPGADDPANGFPEAFAP